MLPAITLAFTLKEQAYTVELRTSREQTCRIASGAKEWFFAPKRLNPWQLRVGEVDGNGKPEILIGVYKRTHLIPHPHRTLFIYEFDGEEVRPKWKASTMGRPLLDFAPAKLKAGHRVITVEKRLDEKQVLTIWKWRGFGLIKLEEIGEGKSIQLEPLPWPGETIVARIDGKTLKWNR